MESGDYRPSDIVVHDAIENIRLRPSMYIGRLSSDGLHELLTIVLDNAMDEALEGHCSQIEVELGSDQSVTVKDDARGIPVVPLPKLGITKLEAVFTVLSACYCGCGEPPGHRRSMSGVGVTVVNALSQSLVVETSRDGERYRMSFQRGRRVGDMERLGPAKGPGTLIHFTPDRSIFDPGARLDMSRLGAQLYAFAALSPGLTLELRDDRSSRSFHCPRGLGDLVQSIADSPRLALPLVAVQRQGQAEVRIAIQLDDGEREGVIGYVNIRRVDAGTHVEGLLEGLDQGVSEAATALGLGARGRPRGVRAVVAVDLPHPELEAQGVRLANPTARGLVSAVTRACVLEWAKSHPQEARAVLEHSPQV